MSQRTVSLGSPSSDVLDDINTTRHASQDSFRYSLQVAHDNINDNFTELFASGLATLVAGEVEVAYPAVTADSRIFYSVQTPGGTQGHLSVAKDAGVSFTITSTNAGDTSVVAWRIVEPAA